MHSRCIPSRRCMYHVRCGVLQYTPRLDGEKREKDGRGILYLTHASAAASPTRRRVSVSLPRDVVPPSPSPSAILLLYDHQQHLDPSEPVCGCRSLRWKCGMRLAHAVNADKPRPNNNDNRSKRSSPKECMMWQKMKKNKNKKSPPLITWPARANFRDIDLPPILQIDFQGTPQRSVLCFQPSPTQRLRTSLRFFRSTVVFAPDTSVPRVSCYNDKYHTVRVV